MSETVVSYALTTKARVKDRMKVTVTDFDTLLDRLISGATDFIESYCDRRFLRTTYTQEVYSLDTAYQKFLILRQSPVVSVSSFQYRGGTPDNPAWTDFLGSEWELLHGGRTGVIRLYSWAGGYNNNVRVTYQAGYLIDFANAGSSTHTLPFDLSDLCERLVIRRFKRREQPGVKQESYNGATIIFSDELDNDDKMILDGYVRANAL